MRNFLIFLIFLGSCKPTFPVLNQNVILHHPGDTIPCIMMGDSVLNNNYKSFWVYGYTIEKKDTSNIYLRKNKTPFRKRVNLLIYDYYYTYKGILIDPDSFRIANPKLYARRKRK